MIYTNKQKWLGLIEFTYRRTMWFNFQGLSRPYLQSARMSCNRHGIESFLAIIVGRRNRILFANSYSPSRIIFYSSLGFLSSAQTLNNRGLLAGRKNLGPNEGASERAFNRSRGIDRSCCSPIANELRDIPLRCHQDARRYHGRPFPCHCEGLLVSGHDETRSQSCPTR